MFDLPVTFQSAPGAKRRTNSRTPRWVWITASFQSAPGAKRRTNFKPRNRPRTVGVSIRARRKAPDEPGDLPEGRHRVLRVSIRARRKAPDEPRHLKRLMCLFSRAGLRERYRAEGTRSKERFADLVKPRVHHVLSVCANQRYIHHCLGFAHMASPKLHDQGLVKVGAPEISVLLHAQVCRFGQAVEP